MNIKIIIGSVIIISAFIFGAVSFVETNVEYADIRTAVSTQKTVQVKGEWIQEKPSSFDIRRTQFSFFVKDENGQEMKVIYEGAKPNNFEIANAVVVKGRYRDGYFHATEILTKCPSKYEANGETVKKTL